MKSLKSNLILHTFLYSAFVLMISCSNNPQSDKESKTETPKKYQAGKTVDKIPCSQNPAYSYALYLPSYFSPVKSFPVIVVFDAHARGKMAVNRFIQAAEKFGYIIVASNNAKNGLKEIDNVVSTLFVDVFNLAGIDKNRVYTAGFSGGAKVAASTAIYKGGIKGVISFAGGMPSVGQEIHNKFNFISVVGSNDFNFHEIKALDKALTNNGFTNQIFTFEGTHEWPKPEVLAKAVEWMELMALKNKEIPVNDNLVRNYLTSYSDSINKCIVTGKNYQAYLLYNIFLKDLEGLYDISDFRKSYEALLQNPEINKTLKAEEASNAKEMKNQESILNMFKSSDFSGLKKEIELLKKNSNSKDEISVHASKRLLSFMGMVCYIYTGNALNTQNKAAFTSTIEIYTQVEPQNPDKEFYKACLAMMEGNQQKAMEFLQKAVEFGYFDADQLQKTPYFEQLKSMPEFDLIVKKALGNFDKQQ